MSDVRPMHDRVIIKRVKEEKTTSAGFIIPDKAIAESDQGHVIACGDGKVLKNGQIHPLTVKVGDRVLFSKAGNQQVKIDGVELLVMREDDIIGILED